MSDLLFTFLQDRDVDCPNCKYNLRALTVSCCPECGLEITLGVQLTEPKLAGFIAGLVPLAMSVGFSGLISLYALLVEPPPSRLWSALFFPGILSAGMLYFWIRWRRWIRAWPISLRILVILICLVVPIANVYFFASMMPP